jgi:hypothetical protein
MAVSCVHAGLIGGSIRLKRMVNAYTDDRMFSVDLVGAVRLYICDIDFSLIDSVAGLATRIVRA